MDDSEALDTRGVFFASGRLIFAIELRALLPPPYIFWLCARVALCIAWANRRQNLRHFECLQEKEFKYYGWRNPNPWIVFLHAQSWAWIWWSNAPRWNFSNGHHILLSPLHYKIVGVSIFEQEQCHACIEDASGETSIWYKARFSHGPAMSFVQPQEFLTLQSS